MARGVTCTFPVSEKCGISQQPKGKSQTKLFHKIFYSIRNSELMIPNRCARRLAEKASMDTSCAQIARNPGFSLSLSSTTWRLMGRPVTSCSRPAFHIQSRSRRTKSIEFSLKKDGNSQILKFLLSQGTEKVSTLDWSSRIVISTNKSSNDRENESERWLSFRLDVSAENFPPDHQFLGWWHK
jgi:hypothetical protein